MALTLREIEFSTRLTWSETSASEVAPKRPTWTPQSFPAAWAPANMACQNCESVALTMTSMCLLLAGDFSPARVVVAPKKGAARTPPVRAPTAAPPAEEEGKNGFEILS